MNNRVPTRFCVLATLVAVAWGGGGYACLAYSFAVTNCAEDLMANSKAGFWKNGSSRCDGREGRLVPGGKAGGGEEEEGLRVWWATWD